MNISKFPTAVILINFSKAKPFWGKLTLEAVELFPELSSPFKCLGHICLLSLFQAEVEEENLVLMGLKVPLKIWHDNQCHGDRSYLNEYSICC